MAEIVTVNGPCDFCKTRRAMPLIAECGHKFCSRCLDVLLPRLTHGCLTSALKVAGEACFGQGEHIAKITKNALFPTLRSPFNQLYVQGFVIGLASYWFDRDLDKCYILYDPEACPEWLLDDGSRPPLRKYFENTSYDHKTRTFRGEVNWNPVRFAGDSKWMYTIIFSEDYRKIMGGRVQSTGEQTRSMLYERDLRYRLAMGVGAADRVQGIAIMSEMVLCSLPRIRVRGRCALSMLTMDIIRRVKDYLVAGNIEFERSTTPKLTSSPPSSVLVTGGRFFVSEQEKTGLLRS